MGIQTFAADGVTKVFDSDDVLNGVCLGALNVPAGVAPQYRFDLLAGGSVRAITPDGRKIAGVAVTYPGSVPVVTCDVSSFARDIVLWGTGAPTIMSSAAGMQAVSSAGTVAISPAGRGMVYRGKGWHHATNASLGSPKNSVSSPSNYLGSVTLRFSSPTRPVLVLRVSSGIYVRQELGSLTQVDANTWAASFQCIDTAAVAGELNWPALLVPDVYAFSASVTPNTAPECSVYDVDGTLAYDLMAGRLLVTDGPMTFAAGSTSDLYSQTITTGTPLGQVGLFGQPSCEVTRVANPGQSGNTGGFYRNSFYESFWSLSGGALQRQRIMTTRNFDDAPEGERIEEEPCTPEIVNLTGL